VPSFDPLENTSYSPLAAVLAALGLAGYALVALGVGSAQLAKVRAAAFRPHEQAADAG
jgi:hypothetical protein